MTRSLHLDAKTAGMKGFDDDISSRERMFKLPKVLLNLGIGWWEEEYEQKPLKYGQFWFTEGKSNAFYLCRNGADGRKELSNLSRLYWPTIITALMVSISFWHL